MHEGLGGLWWRSGKWLGHKETSKVGMAALTALKNNDTIVDLHWHFLLIKLHVALLLLVGI